MGADDGRAAPVLLATKLHVPRRRPGTVDRPRLDNRLVADRLAPVTIVAAPAGFGKTTLLAEWAHARLQHGHATAWLSLDAHDNDPTSFWSYVVAAVHAAHPDAVSRAHDLLQTAEPSTVIVAALVNDLAGIDEDLALVLDDLHVIEEPTVHDALAFLIEHRPPAFHLVIGTRSDPPLPLARLRARGDLLEVRAADLRFTADEAARYCNDAMGLTLTAEDVAVLETRTEGWIAALQLAALSMQGRDDPRAFIAGFAGDDRFVVDYLVEEVLERQSDEVREFLQQTAILDRFTGPLCDAVTGGSGGRAMLERLDRANLFLVPLDDRRHWYRYHHLFADVLRARLTDDAPGRVDELHRRASEWFEAAGDAAEAIAHALAGHHTERAAMLIELAAPALFRTRQEATARRWVDALPDETFDDRPVLSMELVAARMVSGDLHGVEPVLANIERWLRPEADLTRAIVFDHDELARLPAQVAVYRAALALIAGDPAATMAHAQRALELALPSDHLRRGSAAALVGLAQWTQGDIDAAAHHYDRSIAELTAAGHISDVLGCSIAVADLDLVRGRLGDAQRTYENALDLAAAHGVVRGTADMHAGLVTSLVERNDLVAAAAHLDAAERLGEGAGLPQHPYRRRVAAARLRRAEGDLVAALELLEEGERRYNTDMSPPVRPVAAVRAQVQLAAGDLAGARRWMAGRGLGPDDELAYVHEYEHLAVARVLLAVGQAEHDNQTVADARRLLMRLLAAADDGHRIGSAVEISVALALALQASGDRAGAVASLERALSLGAPEEYVRVFADELPAIEPLLRAVPATGAAGAHARVVLAGAASTVVVPPGQGLVDELSARELDVLRLLRSDLSGPDIARELIVSLNTVRTHTKSIYSKLGVNNRREAVRRAAELGL